MWIRVDLVDVSEERIAPNFRVEESRARNQREPVAAGCDTLRNSPLSTDPEGSLLWSDDHPLCSYLESDNPFHMPTPYFFLSSLILSFHVRLDLYMSLIFTFSNCKYLRIYHFYIACYVLRPAHP
jgi:hypothetical protein